MTSINIIQRVEEGNETKYKKKEIHISPAKRIVCKKYIYIYIILDEIKRNISKLYKYLSNSRELMKYETDLQISEWQFEM